MIQFNRFGEREKVRQESVPGKQLTLAHVVAGPHNSLYTGLEMANRFESVGIMRVTPSMTAIIAADVAAKAGGAEIAVMDRFSGSVVILGDVAAVEAGLQGVAEVLGGRLGFDVEKLTRS